MTTRRMVTSNRNHWASGAILAATLTSISPGIAVGASTPPPVTLRMARTTGFADRQIEHLQQAVADVSGGRLVIEVATEWDIGDVVTDVEQQIVGAVAADEADLGLVGSRAFAVLGVTSLAALTAPLLVDSYELQAAILSSDITAAMLADLDALDVTGLALVAGGLRKPIAVDAPLLGVADYDGITMHAFPSSGHEATLNAFGATPVSGTFAERDAGLLDGTIDAYENTIAFFESHLQLASNITVNVNLWPATGVLFANPDTLAALDETQTGWLETAIADTVANSPVIANVDAAILSGSLCDRGANLAVASDADLDELRAAVEPVYTELRSDAATAAFISEIEALEALLDIDPLVPAASCPTGADTAPVASDPRLPDGVYRTAPITAEIAVEALRNRGLPDSASDVSRLDPDQTVVFTLTIDSDRFVLTQSLDGGAGTVVSEGGFDIVDDGVVTVSPAGSPPAAIDFEFDGTTLVMRVALDNAEVQELFASSSSPYVIANTIVIVESVPYTRSTTS